MAKCYTRNYIRQLLKRKELSLNCRKRRVGRKRKIRCKSSRRKREKKPREQIIKEEVEELKPIRKRLHRCCVPNCTTYDTSHSFFPFPATDSTARRIWIDVVPRKNWLICHNTFICKNHFKTKEESITGHEAPTYFPKPLSLNLEDKYRRIDKGMFQISPSYNLPETFGDLALLPNCDRFIFDFYSLKSRYKAELKMVLDVCNWMTEEKEDRLIFYKVYLLDDCVKVSTSILIDQRMKPTIALEGIIMDPLDYTKHVPVNGKITHWNQMNFMLLDFGFDRKEKDQSYKVVRSTIHT